MKKMHMRIIQIRKRALQTGHSIFGFRGSARDILILITP